MNFTLPNPGRVVLKDVTFTDLGLKGKILKKSAYLLIFPALNLRNTPPKEVAAVTAKNNRLKATAAFLSIPIYSWLKMKTSSLAPTPPMVNGNTATMDDNKKTNKYSMI